MLSATGLASEIAIAIAFTWCLAFLNSTWYIFVRSKKSYAHVLHRVIICGIPNSLALRAFNTVDHIFFLCLPQSHAQPPSPLPLLPLLLLFYVCQSCYGCHYCLFLLLVVLFLSSDFVKQFDDVSSSSSSTTTSTSSILVVSHLLLHHNLICHSHRCCCQPWYHYIIILLIAIHTRYK